MGIFRNKTPSCDELCSLTSNIGTAVGQVIGGQMSPDFIDAVVYGSKERRQILFRDAIEEVGREKAIKLARKSASITAGIYADAFGGLVAKRNASRQAAELIDQILNE